MNPSAFAAARDDLLSHSARWWSYLVPPIAHPLIGGSVARMWAAAGVHIGLLEQQVSLGLGVVALALVAVGAWVLRHREPRSLVAVPILAAVAAAALLCSLSPERTIAGVSFVRPSALLYAVVPMFRAYARFGVVVQLMTVLLAGIGAERMWRTGRRSARSACLALVGVAAAEYAVWPPALTRDVLPTSAHRWIMRQSSDVRAYDCVPLTVETASIAWLTHQRIAAGEPSTDCREPNIVDKLAGAGYTHLLVRHRTADAEWFAGRGMPDGLAVAARFNDADAFAITARAPVIYTKEMTTFYAREFDGWWTWRWMGPHGSWTVVNTTPKPIDASVEIELSAFNRPRGARLLLDGRELPPLAIGQQRGRVRIGPLAWSPGQHELLFRASEPPTVAGDVLHNGDPRALSFAVGTWRWAVEGQP
jgi:hypothetical protein